jgi:type I restriction-modification system DNA methylase subunit
MIDRVHRELTDADIARIADTYHAWRGDKASRERPRPEYADVPGFCKTASKEEIAAHGHVLTPGRYVGAEVQEDDAEPFAGLAVDQHQRSAVTLDPDERRGRDVPHPIAVVNRDTREHQRTSITATS